MGVEDLYTFSNLPPHTPFAEMSSLAPFCELAVACSRWLVRHSWLQVRFNAHFITYFCEEVGHEFVNFIVPDGGKTSLGT